MSGQKPVVVFVLGGPGAGKGTQCERISKEFGFKHISAGDCLREERQKPNSKYGPLIEEHIREGLIVPVAITCALLREKMNNYGWEGGRFLIDGFPRNADNVDGWSKASGVSSRSDLFVHPDRVSHTHTRTQLHSGDVSFALV